MLNIINKKNQTLRLLKNLLLLSKMKGKKIVKFGLKLVHMMLEKDVRFKQY